MKRVLFTLLALTLFATASAEFYLASIRVSATIGVDSGDFTLDIDPSFVLGAPLPKLPFLPSDYSWGGVSLPHLAIYNSDDMGHINSNRPLMDEINAIRAYNRNHTVTHELFHVQNHWGSLGPAFLFANVLSGSQPFESYLSNGYDIDKHAHIDTRYQYDHVWVPDASIANQCPMFRISNTSTEFMPCWRF